MGKSGDEKRKADKRRNSKKNILQCLTAKTSFKKDKHMIKNKDE